MATVSAVDVPTGALLAGYQRADQRADQNRAGYVDCYAVDVPHAVSLPQLIEAFYNSPAFRGERWLLGALLRRKADNADVARLAAGQTQKFSAWTVEGRDAQQILLCDFLAKTRSWLMVLPIEGGTRLHFGTAVVPVRGWVESAVFRITLGFHRRYSQVLLRSAASRL